MWLEVVKSVLRLVLLAQSRKAVLIKGGKVRAHAFALRPITHTQSLTRLDANLAMAVQGRGDSAAAVGVCAVQEELCREARRAHGQDVCCEEECVVRWFAVRVLSFGRCG